MDTTLNQVIRVVSFILLLLAILFLVGYCWPQPAVAKDLPGKDDISSAINWLATVQYKNEQRALGVKWGEHPILENEKMIDEISDGVVSASRELSVNPYLILTVMWRESRFEQRVYDLQKRGYSKQEIGLMQVHGMAARGCDLSSYSGQIVCGTKWLRRCLDICEGSELGALTFYATGKMCVPHKNTNLERSMNNRYKLCQELMNI